jgi:hypothetical protein
MELEKDQGETTKKILRPVQAVMCVIGGKKKTPAYS